MKIKCTKCLGTGIANGICSRCSGEGFLLDKAAENAMLIDLASSRMTISFRDDEGNSCRGILLHFNPDTNKAKVRYFATHTIINKNQIKGVQYP